VKTSKYLFRERELSPDSINLDKAYEMFATNYIKATGVAWSKNKFLSRAQNWKFYGEEGKGYVAVRPQRSGLIKLVGVGGSPLAIAKGMKELLALKKPVWGMVSAELVKAVNKLGLKTPPAWVIRQMLKSIPSNVISSAPYTINSDGSITLEYEDVGRARKFFVANNEYYKWILKIVADKLPGPVKYVIELMAKGISITKKIIGKIKNLFTEEELRECLYYESTDYINRKISYSNKRNTWKI
jgi:hypothetical protein